VDTFPVGAEVEGEVKNITEFGLFIGLDGDIDGMAHLSDLNWEKSGEEALTDYKKGDMVKAKVLDVDVEKERISLGIKQLSEDPVGGALAEVKKGDVVTCTVSAIVDNGIEVRVNDSIPGFIRKSELSRDRSEQRPDRFATGEKVDAKVTQVDKSGRRMTLSIKAREAEEEKKAMAEFGSTDAGASLGDILGAAIAEKAAEVEKQAEDDVPAKEGKPTKKKVAKKAAEAELGVEVNAADDAPTKDAVEGAEGSKEN
jgi:small subunit ribosomal protein S1